MSKIIPIRSGRTQAKRERSAASGFALGCALGAAFWLGLIATALSIF